MERVVLKTQYSKPGLEFRSTHIIHPEGAWVETQRPGCWLVREPVSGLGSSLAGCSK